MKTASVIIPCFNRASKLKITIDALERCEPKPSEVTLVDQSKTPVDEQIKEIVSACGGLNVKYIHKEAPSLTYARNVGINSSEGDMLIFMDDDVIVPRDIFASLDEVMQDTDVVMVAGLNSKANKGYSRWGYLVDLKSFENRKIGHVTASMLGRYPAISIIKAEGEVEAQCAMSYFFAVDRFLMDKYKIRFEDRFEKYAYAENMDFTMRYACAARAENRRCVIDNRVMVEHTASQEWRIPSKETTYMYAMHRMYLLYKNQAGVGRWIAFWWSLVGIFLVRVDRKDCISDDVGAIKHGIKYRHRIKNGELMYEYY